MITSVILFEDKLKGIGAIAAQRHRLKRIEHPEHKIIQLGLKFQTPACLLTFDVWPGRVKAARGVRVVT